MDWTYVTPGMMAGSVSQAGRADEERYGGKRHRILPLPMARSASLTYGGNTLLWVSRPPPEFLFRMRRTNLSTSTLWRWTRMASWPNLAGLAVLLVAATARADDPAARARTTKVWSGRYGPRSSSSTTSTLNDGNRRSHS